MKKAIMAIVAVMFLASCQSPYLSVDSKAKKLVKYEQPVTTITITIE